VRPRNRDAAALRHELREQRTAMEDRDAAFVSREQFGIVLVDRRADDDRRRARAVFRRVADCDARSLGGERVGERGPSIRRPTHGDAACHQDARERRHADAADAHEMNAVAGVARR
jgi:hypothetical protein